MDNRLNEALSTLYSKQDAYWDHWISERESQFDNEDENKEKDEGYRFNRSLFELVKVAVENEQYKVPINEDEEVSRVVKFRVRLSREEIHKLFKVKTYSVYGIGLFTVMNGILLSSATRNLTGYDTKGKHAYFDTRIFSDEIKENYDFRLATPALGGLFIPKKSNLTRWMNSGSQLEYFDLTYDLM